MLRMILAMGLTRWRYIGLWASVLLTLACVAILATKGSPSGSISPAGSCWSFASRP